MKTCLAVCFPAVVFAVCGCTAPHAITRGQSPHHGETSVLPASYGNLATIQHPLQDELTYSSSYHSTSGFPGYNPYASCPPGGCPSGGYGYGGPCGYGCGNGQGCPHHYHSYAYSRPDDLVYPPANAPGGAVVYPYYTHKGPSDFFRDDCKCTY